MNILRQLITWIDRHRLLSGIGIATILVGTLAIRFELDRSQGDLTDPVERGAIVDSIYGIGTVTANRIFQIKPGVVTTIVDLFVKEGDQVKKGDRLANIDRVIFKAPFPGTVTSLPYNVGENVFAQLPIMTLVDLQDRYVIVSMEQQGALRVRVGQPVKLNFDSIREQSFEGRVNAVYSYQSNFLARINVGHLPANILPGMTADVAIQILEKKDVMLLPVAGIEPGGQVWVKRGFCFPKKIPVKVGIVDKSFAEMIDGDVVAGDRLLIRRKLIP